MIHEQKMIMIRDKVYLSFNKKVSIMVEVYTFMDVGSESHYYYKEKYYESVYILYRTTFLNTILCWEW